MWYIVVNLVTSQLSNSEFFFENLSTIDKVTVCNAMSPFLDHPVYSECRKFTSQNVTANRMRYGTGTRSQWRSRGSEVMYSERAATLRTDFSLPVRCPETPSTSSSQQVDFADDHTTTARTSINKACCGRKRCTLRVCRSAAKSDGAREWTYCMRPFRYDVKHFITVLPRP